MTPKTVKTKKKLRQFDLETAVSAFTSTAEQPFRLKDILTAIRQQAGTGRQLRNLEGTVWELLNGDSNLFHEEKTERYVPRAHFFRGMKFRIKPTEDELDEGILFPGHRFIPFLSPDVLPPESSLHLPDGSVAPTKRIECDKDEVGVYFSLFSFQDVLFYWALDSELDMEELHTSDHAFARLNLTVFDMASVYERYSFKPGDSFVLTVEDWRTGRYRIEHTPAKDLELAFAQLKKWCDCLEDALSTVFEELGPYTTVEEQLAHAFWFGKKHLGRFPGLAIGSFLNQSQAIMVHHQEERTFLWPKGEDPIDDDLFAEWHGEGPVGNMYSLGAILKDVGLDLTEDELRAFMRDELYHGGNDLKAVLERCLAERDLEFYDRAQQRAFHQFLQDEWEEEQAKYNRFADQRRGKVRTEILQLKDSHLRWLRKLDAAGVDPADLPVDETMQLARLTEMLTYTLVLLDQGDHDLDYSEVQRGMQDTAMVMTEMMAEIDGILGI